MSDNERIAVLETQMDEVDSLLKEKVIPTLERIEARQSRQAGFAAGVMFAWTLIVGLAAAVWQWVSK